MWPASCSTDWTGAAPGQHGSDQSSSAGSGNGAFCVRVGSTQEKVTVVPSGPPWTVLVAWPMDSRARVSGMGAAQKYDAGVRHRLAGHHDDVDIWFAESTVKLHLHSAFTKLGVSNRVQLSLLARDRGWI